MTNQNDNNLAVLTHILGFLTGFVAPLIFYLVATSKEVKKHGANALNWQISLIIYFAASFILAFVIIGFALIAVLGILNLIFCIKAAIKASNGEIWEYPLTIKFIKE